MAPRPFPVDGIRPLKGPPLLDVWVKAAGTEPHRLILGWAAVRLPAHQDIDRDQVVRVGQTRAAVTAVGHWLTSCASRLFSGIAARTADKSQMQPEAQSHV